MLLLLSLHRVLTKAFIFFLTQTCHSDYRAEIYATSCVSLIRCSITSTKSILECTQTYLFMIIIKYYACSVVQTSQSVNTLYQVLLTVVQKSQSVLKYICLSSLSNIMNCIFLYTADRAVDCVIQASPKILRDVVPSISINVLTRYTIYKFIF